MPKQLSPTINFDLLAKILVIALTCLWLPGITQSGLQLMILDYFGPLLLAASLLFPSERETRNPAPLLLIAACVCTTIFTNFRGYPSDLIHITGACCIYWALVRNLKDPKGLAAVIAYIAIANITLALCQKSGFNPIYVTEPALNKIQELHLSMPGVMGRNYHLSYFIIAAIPLAFYFNWRIGMLLTMLASVAVFLIGSYILVFSLLAVILYGLSQWIDTRVVLCIVLVALGAGIGLKHETIANKLMVRKEVYAFSVQEIVANPFVGHGLGTFDVAINLDSNTPKFDSSYNQWLKAAFEIGLLPILLVVMAMWRYFKSFRTFNAYILVAICALMFFPMFHETLRFARLTTLSVVILSLLEITCLEQNRRAA